MTARLGFGTSGLLRVAGHRRRADLLCVAFDLGMAHFDTAPIYGLGQAERSLRQFLRGRRDQVTVTTKFGLSVGPLARRVAPLQRLARRTLTLLPRLRRAAIRHAPRLYLAPNFDVQHVRQSLEHSLRAMQTDYVDYFLAHEATRTSMPGEDLIDALTRWRAAGLIRRFGIASRFSELDALRLRLRALSDVLQFESSITAPNVSRMSVDANTMLITHSVFQQDIAKVRAALATVEPRAIAALSDQTVGDLCIRSAVLANTSGIVLIQSQSAARLSRNVAAALRSDHDAVIARLSAAVVASQA